MVGGENMEWTYENLELDEAYDELSEKIGKLLAIRKFLIESVTDNTSDEIKVHVWRLDDKARSDVFKLLDVQKSLRKIRRRGI
jgi:glycerophosphoryl diester phosphodiesterase